MTFAQMKGREAKAEIHRWLPLTKFYDAPQPLPRGKPGDLIRSEESEDYALAPGINALRILYHTVAANGDAEASSGFILYPDEKPPAGGWPIIAWAHEANEVARQCAPSLSRILAHGPFLAMYVNLGYAVVATDYAGLGTSARYAFSDMQSNANDVIYSIPAARAALPQLARQWIVIGSESSSRTALAVAEREHEIRDPNYLGSVVIGGLSDLETEYRRPDPLSPAFLAQGIKAVYPSFDPSEILTEKGLAHYRQIGQSCDATAAAAAELVRSGWLTNKFVKQFFERNRPGQKPFSAAVLALAAGPTPTENGAEAVNVTRQLCRQGVRVQFQRYDDLDPGNVIGDSVRDQMAWIQGRMAGRPAPSNCSDFR
jgi:hypothetical protein